MCRLELMRYGAMCREGREMIRREVSDRVRAEKVRVVD